MSNLNFKKFFSVGQLIKKPYSASLLILIALFTIYWFLYVITEHPMSYINTSSDSFCYLYLGIKDFDSSTSLGQLLLASGENMSLTDFRSQSEVNCSLFTNRDFYFVPLGLIIKFLGFNSSLIISLVSFYILILCILSIPRIRNSVAILSIIIIMTSPYILKLVTTVNIDLLICALISANLILTLKMFSEPKKSLFLIVYSITLIVGSLRVSILLLGLPYLYFLLLRWEKRVLVLDKSLKVFIAFHCCFIIGFTLWNPNEFRTPNFSSTLSTIKAPVQKSIPLRSIGELLKNDLSLSILFTFFLLIIFAMTIKKVSISLTVFAYAILIAFLSTEVFAQYPSTHLRLSIPFLCFIIFVMSEYYNSVGKNMEG